MIYWIFPRKPNVPVVTTSCYCEPKRVPSAAVSYTRIKAPSMIPSITIFTARRSSPAMKQLHKILETRCLPIIMPNRPGNYENPRPELALELKERLTAWRAKHLFTAFADMEPIEGISGRLWDITKPMFFMNSLIPVDHQILEDSILAIAGEKDESRKDSLEGRLVAIIKEITDEDGLDQFGEWNIKISDIRTRFNQGRPEDRQVSPQWIGKRLKSMSLRSRIVHGYSEIMMTLPEYEMLLKQYGYLGRESDSEPSKPTNSLPENNEQNHDVPGVVEQW